MSMITNADDSTVPLNNREDLITGAKTEFRIMKEWRSTADTGCHGKKYKTELFLFPSTKNLKECRYRAKELAIDTCDDYSAQVMKWYGMVW